MTAVSLHEAYLIGLAQSLGAILSIFITYPLQNLVTRFQIHSLLENNAAKEEQSIKEDLLLNQENLANEGKDNKKLVKKDPPLDSLKTIKPESQMPNREEAVHKLSDWEIFIKILQEEGISKLYTGLGVAMVGTGLQQGIFSFLHESLKSYYRSTVALNLPNFINFSYGMISGSQY